MNGNEGKIFVFLICFFYLASSPTQNFNHLARSLIINFSIFLVWPLFRTRLWFQELFHRDYLDCCPTIKSHVSSIFHGLYCLTISFFSSGLRLCKFNISLKNLFWTTSSLSISIMFVCTFECNIQYLISHKFCIIYWGKQDPDTKKIY